MYICDFECSKIASLFTSSTKPSTSGSYTTRLEWQICNLFFSVGLGIQTEDFRSVNKIDTFWFWGGDQMP